MIKESNKLTCPNCRIKIEKFKKYLKRQNFSYPGSKKNILNKIDEDLLDKYVIEEIIKLENKKNEKRKLTLRGRR